MNNKIAYLLATGFGSGYSPYFPGTSGSLVALLIFMLLDLGNLTWVIVCFIIFFTGVWSARIVEEKHGKDPGLVVIDEFVGQWIALLFLPRTMIIFITAFILFRILDILKPQPADYSQKLPHGWGIMTDDVIAGIYTNILIQTALFLFKIF